MSGYLKKAQHMSLLFMMICNLERPPNVRYFKHHLTLGRLKCDQLIIGMQINFFFEKNIEKIERFFVFFIFIRDVLFRIFKSLIDHPLTILQKFHCKMYSDNFCLHDFYVTFLQHQSENRSSEIVFVVLIQRTEIF